MTQLSNLISDEAKKLNRPPERTYEQSFDQFRDNAGNVVWTVIVGGQKPFQKWFKAATHFSTALEKARSVVVKTGHTGNFTLVLEARPTILAKLGGK